MDFKKLSMMLWITLGKSSLPEKEIEIALRECYTAGLMRGANLLKEKFNFDGNLLPLTRGQIISQLELECNEAIKAEAKKEGGE
jgi:hypothetical protein